MFVLRKPKSYLLHLWINFTMQLIILHNKNIKKKEPISLSIISKMINWDFIKGWTLRAFAIRLRHYLHFIANRWLVSRVYFLKKFYNILKEMTDNKIYNNIRI
ncbi:unnamed protein product [Blepharisma stoltei]|uniref:Uncharacterized protein n=1 Tax=Blepharisma stoltei TaxID=1481888 RepID=A0AAU9IAV6_9CILI|nr:unnamed protein product [Blepharisma stoltei]